ncbi:MAG: hypothetical protein KGI25_10255, partial [Thaumarchaeota archaeon]|nr:hypothetical protein [Nitrososphaerota archaeon]
MNKPDLENYVKEITTKFSDKIKRFDYNYNEIHFYIQDPKDTLEICNHVHANMNARLATIICTDERKHGHGFAIRY